MRTSVLLACLVFAASTGHVARAAGPLPSLPGQAGVQTGGQSGAPGAAPSPSVEPASVIERVRKGIVMLERDGRLVGFGTVLGGDGRILTALSAMGAGDAVNVRYADGSQVPAKIGHRDKSWDLALLIPQSGKWKDGLTASEADPAAVELRAPIPLKIGAKPIALPVRFKGKMDALSKEGEALANALEVELHHNLPIAGAPLLDGAGTVVGVIVQACKLSMPAASPGAKAPACTPMLVGAPVSAIRSFLISTPMNAVQPPPWLGIVGQPDASGPMHGVRVMAVAPSSPAEKGGLKSSPERDRSDLIVAVDGQPVDSPEKLADAIAKHGVGETVKLLVLGGAASAQDTPSFREVAVVLRAAP